MQNDLSALDTRVTNAITGGDLAAPFEYDVKNSAYDDTVDNINYWDYSNKSLYFTTNRVKVCGRFTNRTPSYPVTGTRTYSKVFDIKANYNLKANLSVTTDYGNPTGYVLIMLLDAISGTTLHQRQIDLGSALNESIPLSSFNGEQVKVVLKTVKTGSPQDSYTINCNINSIIITNK